MSNELVTQFPMKVTSIVMYHVQAEHLPMSAEPGIISNEMCAIWMNEESIKAYLGALVNISDWTQVRFSRITLYADFGRTDGDWVTATYSKADDTPPWWPADGWYLEASK